MNTKVFTLLLFIGIGFFISCNGNDDSSTKEETISGIWNLKNVHGGLQGINIGYALGNVKWNFNLENNTLIVENNIVTTGPEDIYSGLDSGTYNFGIEQNGEIQTLFINDTKRGVIILVNNNLKIDDGLASDGFITEFER